MDGIKESSVSTRRNNEMLKLINLFKENQEFGENCLSALSKKWEEYEQKQNHYRNDISNKKSETKFIDEEIVSITEKKAALNKKLNSQKEKLKNTKSNACVNNSILKDLKNKIKEINTDHDKKREEIKKAYFIKVNKCSCFEKYFDVEVWLESPHMFEFKMKHLRFKLESSDLRNWKLISIKPEMVDKEKLQCILQETNDIHVVLLYLYKKVSQLQEQQSL